MKEEVSVHASLRFPFAPFTLIFKICIVTAMLIAMHCLAIAADQPSTSNPCNLTHQNAEGLDGDLGVEINALRDYTGTIVRLLKEEQYEQLDCLADHARSSKERLAGGIWKLHQLYAGLYEVTPPPTHATQEDWHILLERLEKYVSARPNSITARVALATAYINYAWDARGGGYSDTVSDSGWKLFQERTAKAQRILEDAAELPGKCPEWYVAMQMVAQNQGWI